jgi:predicted membrane channel-forming protein YqfA (hemolysin III family)
LDALGIFVFIVWFWLAITVFADLFRRHDISGWIKAIWVIAVIVFPYIAVLAYLIFQSRGMAERRVEQAQQTRDELRRVVGFSLADELQKLDGLKKAGSISDAEFTRLRARLVAA